MRLQVISRSKREYQRDTNGDVERVFRSLAPELRPMEQAKEVTRAKQGVKLERMFAKPFMGAMGGHREGVTAMRGSGKRLAHLVTGDAEGVIRLWDVAYKRTIQKFSGHRGAIRGLSIDSEGEFLVSCGDDCTVRLWQVPSMELGESGEGEADTEPISIFQGKNSFRAVDFRRSSPLFATAGAQVDVWDRNRSEAIKSFSWGTDSVYSVRFNPAEPDVFATTASDRSIALYDLRMEAPLRKLVMQTRLNQVAWNPREAFNFTAASEDSNCYSYDMRKLKTATCVHKDHVSAVMDLDYSPTGREFVTGSYDRSVRIFAYNGGHSREVYHTKRMQRVFCVNFSGDGTYVTSGSDDTNIRLWKANASEQLGVILPRERQKHAYLAALKERYKNLPEIKSIDRHRHLPQALFKAGKLRQQVAESERRKEMHRKAHSKPTNEGPKGKNTMRRKRVVTELE